jgi:hypothetical protein
VVVGSLTALPLFERFDRVVQSAVPDRNGSRGREKEMVFDGRGVRHDAGSGLRLRSNAGTCWPSLQKEI